MVFIACQPWRLYLCQLPCQVVPTRAAHVYGQQQHGALCSPRRFIDKNLALYTMLFKTYIWALTDEAFCQFRSTLPTCFLTVARSPKRQAFQRICFSVWNLLTFEAIILYQCIVIVNTKCSVPLLAVQTLTWLLSDSPSLPHHMQCFLPTQHKILQ